MPPNPDKFTKTQLELFNIFRHITDEKQLNEVKSLLNFYFKAKLNDAINSEEVVRNYSADIYQLWLKNVNN